MMLNLFSKEKPSKTAFRAAWMRAWACIDFKNQIWGQDFLAECFLPLYIRLLLKSKKYRNLGKEIAKKTSPGVYEYVIARTLFFDEVFSQALKESVPQIVLLGAGYDSRGIRFKHLNINSHIIELDMASTQNRKIKCLKKCRIKSPEYLTYAAIDFNSQSLESALTSAGYNKDMPTLFLWEGVSMYLETQSIKDTLTFIQKCSSPESSRLVFDYVVSFPEENIHQYYGAKEMLKTMREEFKNEPFTFSLKEENLEDFLKGSGHKVIRHLNKDQIEKTYLKKADGSSIGKPNGLFNLVITSPTS